MELPVSEKNTIDTLADALTKKLGDITAFLEQRVATKQDLVVLYNRLANRTDTDVGHLESKITTNIEDLENEMLSEVSKTIHLELEDIKKRLRTLESETTPEGMLQHDQQLLELRARIANLEKQVNGLKNRVS